MFSCENKKNEIFSTFQWKWVGTVFGEKLNNILQKTQDTIFLVYNSSIYISVLSYFVM